jgi:hypothetical protein
MPVRVDAEQVGQRAVVHADELRDLVSGEPGQIRDPPAWARVIESGWNGSRMVFDMACSPAI